MVILSNYSNGANILYLNGITSPSHHFWNTALVNALAARGHNVTFVTADTEKHPQKNVHYFVMSELYNEAYDEVAQGFFNFVDIATPITEPNFFTEYALNICGEIVNSAAFKRLLDYPNDFRFDLIINDMTLGGCMLGFAHKFQYPPIISATAFSHPPYLSEYIGGHHYYAYIPHYALPYHGDLNFVQKVYNIFIHMLSYYNWQYDYIPKVDKIMKEAYGSDLPSASELEKRTAIAFVSTTPVFDTTQPLPENVIQVAGLHVKDPKPLPEDIEEIITSSKKGAVFFSLGSNAPSSAMSLEKKLIFLSAFAQFPDYNFLWKYEKPIVGFELPKNVFIRPWLPQSDILNHTKVKAFITHSGSLSTFESIWRGVPMVGVPFAFDQHGNILKSIEKGVAEQVDFTTLSTKMVVDTLRKVLDNPKYYDNAKQLSIRLQDQKEKPLDRAVWWAEWLIRNPNCEYLKSPILRLGYIAGNSYDVIAIISIALFVVAWNITKLSLYLLRVLFGQSTSSRVHQIEQVKQKKRQ